MDRERELRESEQRRGLAALDGAMALMLILLIIQIWLISATLNAFLAGYDETAVPGAIVSGVLFLGCFGLYRFVTRLDKRSQNVRDRETRPSHR
jgi:hypothetical protein